MHLDVAHDTTISNCKTEQPAFFDLKKESALKQHEIFEGMPYHIDFIQLPETLKLIGVAKTHDWTYSNIEDYHKNYANLIENMTLPYTEIGVASNIRNATSPDYIFGCLVNSLENIPLGMFGLDTGFNNFVVMTFRANNAEELCTSENHGMSLALKYLAQQWIPKNKDMIIDLNDHFQFKKEYFGKLCETSIFEIYEYNINVEPEMSIYIPLKN